MTILIFIWEGFFLPRPGFWLVARVRERILKRSRASTRVLGADVFSSFFDWVLRFSSGFRCSFVWRGGAADRRAFGWSLASALQHAFRELMFLSSFFDWVLRFFFGISMFFRLARGRG